MEYANYVNVYVTLPF